MRSDGVTVQATLLQRPRVIATVIVLLLFAGAVAEAVFRVSAIDEAESSARQAAAARQAAELKADYEAHKASIATAIGDALARGRVDDAGALLRKYRPVAAGTLDELNARWERESGARAAGR